MTTLMPAGGMPSKARTAMLIAVNVVVFLLTPAAGSTGVTEADVAEVCRQEAFYDRYAAVR